jgi:hypothetical protein
MASIVRPTANRNSNKRNAAIEALETCSRMFDYLEMSIGEILSKVTSKPLRSNVLVIWQEIM